MMYMKKEQRSVRISREELPAECSIYEAGKRIFDDSAAMGEWEDFTESVNSGEAKIRIDHSTIAQFIEHGSPDKSQFNDNECRACIYYRGYPLGEFGACKLSVDDLETICVSDDDTCTHWRGYE